MRGWLTTAGEVAGVGLVAAGVFLVFGLGWALAFAGIALVGICFLIGRDA